MSPSEMNNFGSMTNEELERLLETNAAMRLEDGNRKCSFTEGPVNHKIKGSPWFEWFKDVQTACQLCGKPAVEKHYKKMSNANCYQWQCTETQPHADHNVELVVWDCVQDLNENKKELEKTCNCK